MRERLGSRVLDLERRVMLLEAKVRLTTAELKQRPAAKAPLVKLGRPRPRCPGCLLELPKGRKGETCVWCGFVFSALESPLRRSRAAKRK